MLRSAIVGHVLGPSDAPIRRRWAASTETEQRLKGRSRFPPAVVSKRELVHVHLELSTTDAMMGPDEPLLKIADRTPDKLLHWRTDAESRAYSSETAAAPRRYTTYGGVLKQPDK